MNPVKQASLTPLLLNTENIRHFKLKNEHDSTGLNVALLVWGELPAVFHKISIFLFLLANSTNTPSFAFKDAPVFPEPHCPSVLSRMVPKIWRRSPITFLNDTVHHTIDRLKGKDPFQGHPKPTQMGSLEFFSLYLKNMFSPLTVLKEVQRRYGDELLVEFPNGKRLMFLTDTKLLDFVLRQTDGKGGAGGSFMKSDLHSGGPGPSGGMGQYMGLQGVFLSKGVQHKESRMLITPPFSKRVIENPAAYAKYVGLINEHIDRIKEAIAKSPNGVVEENLRPIMNSITLDFAFSTFFSKKLSPSQLLEVGNDFTEVLDWLTLETANPLRKSLAEMPFSFFKGHTNLRKSHQRLWKVADEILKERRSGAVPPSMDMLQFLLEARTTEGNPLSDEYIRYEILTMLLAGHDTTATSLTWGFHLMGMHPEAQNRLRAEVDAVKGGPIDPDTMNSKIPFLEQIFQETVRLFPPGYFIARTAKADTEISTSKGEKIFIPKDTEVVLQFFNSHRGREQWDRTGYPANDFAPERWDPENRIARNLTDEDMITFPWGGGPRICLGMHLALAEFKLVMARMYQEFDIEPVTPGHGVMISDLAVKLKGGYPVRFRNRQPQR